MKSLEYTNILITSIKGYLHAEIREETKVLGEYVLDHLEELKMLILEDSGVQLTSSQLELSRQAGLTPEHMLCILRKEFPYAPNWGNSNTEVKDE